MPSYGSAWRFDFRVTQASPGDRSAVAWICNAALAKNRVRHFKQLTWATFCACTLGCGSKPADPTGEVAARAVSRNLLHQNRHDRIARMMISSDVKRLESGVSMPPIKAGHTYMGMGLFLRADGREAEASDYFHKAAECFLSGEFYLHAAQARGSQGHSLQKLGQYQEAEPILQESLDLFAQVDQLNSACCARVLADQAIIRLQDRKVQEARTLLEQARTICATDLTTPPMLHIEVLNHLGQLETQSGDYAAAQRHYQATLRLVESVQVNDQVIKTAVQRNRTNTPAKAP